jgi:broad specificity phosphatase PhoE
VRSREIWLVRHAESEWNALGRWQGQADPALSELGRARAAALAAALAGERFDALVASDLARARETAEILGGRLGLAPRLDERLRERDAGRWAGLTHDEIAVRWPEELARVRRHEPDARPVGGESLVEVAARARTFFRDLAGEASLARVLVVTHGGLMRSLLREPAVIPNLHVARTRLDVLAGAAPPA